MFQTFEQAQKYVRDDGVEMIDLKFCDLWGRWHHLTIPASQFEPDIMDRAARLQPVVGLALRINPQLK